MVMSWEDYQKYIDKKVSDTSYNYKYAKERFLEAKLNYENALLEKKSFEKELNEMMIKIEIKQKEGEC